MTVGARPRPVTPVGILAATLDRLLVRLESDGAAPDVLGELRAAATLAGGLDPYTERSTTPESAALQRVSTLTRAEEWAGRETTGPAPLEQEMLSGHVEGQLLKMLVHATRATRILEIGMFTGYSALAMAEALPAGGVLVACEIDPHVAGLAREGFAGSPDGAKIDVRVGPALATLAELRGQSFDLVFIDADKVTYLDYLDAALGLLAPHGLVCVDNTLLQGQPWTDVRRTVNGDAVAAFNEAVAGDPRLEQVLVPIRDGLTLIRRVG